MSDSIQLNAAVRADHGKGAARRMRRLDDRIPAVVYGAGADPVSISLSHKEMFMALENEATYSSVLTLNVGGKAEAVVLKALQRHPYKARIMHADFMRIDAKAKMTMSVPLHFINEDVCIGAKAGGVVSRMVTEVEIKCLPANLPEFIEVDVAGLDVDHSLHMTDIKLPKGAEFAHAIDADHNQPIVSVQKSRQAESEEDTVVAEEAPAEE